MVDATVDVADAVVSVADELEAGALLATGTDEDEAVPEPGRHCE